MKLLLEPIEVWAVDGLPQRILWRRRTWPVDQLLDQWVWRGRWWKEPTLVGETRHYFRVLSRGSTLEIYVSDGAWVLSRVWD